MARGDRLEKREPFRLLDHQDWRRAVAEWRTRRRERSMRWLAEKTGSALGHVSEMLSATRRRTPSPGFIEILGTLLELTPVERRYFEALVRADVADAEKRRRRQAKDFVSADRFEAEERAAWEEIRLVAALHGRDAPDAVGLIDRWVAGSVHEAAQLGAPADPAELARLLLPQVTEGEAREALAWLLEAGLVTAEGGGLRHAREDILWFDAEDSADERRSKMLAAHQAALRHYYWGLDTGNVPREARSYKLVFQALPEDLLPEINQRMDELIAWVHDQARTRGGPGAVYVLGFQAVPATRRLPGR